MYAGEDKAVVIVNIPLLRSMVISHSDTTEYKNTKNEKHRRASKGFEWLAVRD